MILLLFLFFTIGCAVGSFLNVVIDRTTRGESLLGRSKCEHCGATLSTLDLVPIISFAGLRARCRYCKHKLSWQYPIVETLTGILFVSTFLFLAGPANLSILNLAYYLFIISILIVVAVIDLKYSLIPTTFVFAASLIAIFWDYFHLSSQDFVTTTVSAFLMSLSFILIVAVTRGRGMGTGDIPLVFLLGLLLVWPLNLLSVFLAFVGGAVISIFLLLTGKKKFGQAIPFGPFLIGGTITVLFWGEEILEWYLKLF